MTNPAGRRALDTIAHSQLRSLCHGEWVYTLLGPRGAYLAEIDRFVCALTSEGVYDDQLEAWATAAFGDCEAT